MPAAAVIFIQRVYVSVVAVKKFVVFSVCVGGVWLVLVLVD